VACRKIYLLILAESEAYGIEAVMAEKKITKKGKNSAAAASV
jgi:hypothetical protein